MKSYLALLFMLLFFQVALAQNFNQSYIRQSVTYLMDMDRVVRGNEIEPDYTKRAANILLKYRKDYEVRRIYCNETFAAAMATNDSNLIEEFLIQHFKRGYTMTEMQETADHLVRKRVLANSNFIDSHPDYVLDLFKKNHVYSKYQSRGVSRFDGVLAHLNSEYDDIDGTLEESLRSDYISWLKKNAFTVYGVGHYSTIFKEMLSIFTCDNFADAKIKECLDVFVKRSFISRGDILYYKNKNCDTQGTLFTTFDFFDPMTSQDIGDSNDILEMNKERKKVGLVPIQFCPFSVDIYISRDIPRPDYQTIEAFLENNMQ